MSVVCFPQRVQRRRNSCDYHKSYSRGCPSCQERSLRAYHERKRSIQQGRWDNALVDVAPARDHLRVLTGLHMMTQNRIAELSGVTATVINRILVGARTRATQWTVDAICAVRPETTPTARIPIHGTGRRLQALAAAGYDAEHLAEMMVCSGYSLRRVRAMRGPSVTVGIALQVKSLCDRLGDTRGPSQAARDLAARYRWVRAIDWEGLAIDDPNTMPPAWPDSDSVDERVVADALRGKVHFNRLTTPEKELMYRTWRQQRQDTGQPCGRYSFAHEFGIDPWRVRPIAKAVKESDPLLAFSNQSREAA